MAGKYFNQWQIGDSIVHEIRRTVTETDNLLFSVMTHNPQPLHIDAEAAKASARSSGTPDSSRVAIDRVRIASDSSWSVVRRDSRSRNPAGAADVDAGRDDRDSEADAPGVGSRSITHSERRRSTSAAASAETASTSPRVIAPCASAA